MASSKVQSAPSADLFKPIIKRENIFHSCANSYKTGVNEESLDAHKAKMAGNWPLAPKTAAEKKAHYANIEDLWAHDRCEKDWSTSAYNFFDALFEHPEWLKKTNTEDLTPLQCMLKNLHFPRSRPFYYGGKSFKALLIQHADFNANKIGFTPLQNAAMIGSGGVEYLLSFRSSNGRPLVDINPKSNIGRTALHYACDALNCAFLYNQTQDTKDQRLRNVKLLLANGADPKAKDSDGKVPFDLLFKVDPADPRKGDATHRKMILDYLDAYKL
jgi:hypothetical protein